MRKVGILCLIICFCSSAAYSQLLNLEGTSGNVLREQKYKNIEGSPYLFTSYKSTRVFDRRGNVDNVFAKYDVYKEELEVYNDGNPIILDPKLYGAFMFDFIDEETNKRVQFLFKNGYKIDKYKVVDYFQVLKDEGKIKFLKKINITSVDEDQATYSGNNDVATRFVRTEKYFVLNGDKVNSFKKLSKSNLFKIFGENDEDVLFLKKNRSKLKTEQEVIVYLNYKENNP